MFDPFARSRAFSATSFTDADVPGFWQVRAPPPELPRSRQSAHLSILSTKRVAEKASQKRFIYNQRSRAFSATHFTDENSQLVGLTGELPLRMADFGAPVHPFLLVKFTKKNFFLSK